MEIVLISGKAGHGKDTLADFIAMELKNRAQKVLIIHYGDLLKYNMCRSYFNWDGKKDEYGRTLLQRIGTDVIRKQNPDFWVNYISSVLSFFKEGYWDYVIIPDCRFPNEIEGLNSFSCKWIKIVRPGYDMLTDEQKQHASETALDNYPRQPWKTVINMGPLSNLVYQAMDISKELMKTNNEEEGEPS